MDNQPLSLMACVVLFVEAGAAILAPRATRADCGRLQAEVTALRRAHSEAERLHAPTPSPAARAPTRPWPA